MEKLKHLEYVLSYTVAAICIGLFIFFKIKGWDTSPLIMLGPLLFIAMLIIILIVGLLDMKNNGKVNTRVMKNNNLDSLKSNNIFYDLKLEQIYGTQNNLLLVAICNVENVDYFFISLYSGAGEEIMNRVAESGITKIKTYVDLALPRIFEFDINDLLNKLGVTSPITQVDLRVIASRAKLDKIVNDLKRKMR